jgi:hypothetical protein
MQCKTTEEKAMSSVVIVKGGQGFVVSSDSIVYKYPTAPSGERLGKVKGVTRKLFQIHDDIVVAAVGNWNSYFPMFNAVASMGSSKLLDELRTRAAQSTDARIYILSRQKNDVALDIVENGEAKLNCSGAIMYPEQSLNSLFLTLYESPDAKAIRASGMVGIAALVHAYNAFALSLCSDISAPFDTILFLRDGLFAFKGGVTRLPVGAFM